MASNNAPAMATFNTLGLSPYSVKFKMTLKEFEQEVLNIAKSYISDFDYAIVEENKRGNLALVLWLPSNSEHLIDKGSTGGRSILQKPLRSLSSALRNFKKKFCADTFIGEERFRPTDPARRFGEIIVISENASCNVPHNGIVVNPTIFFDIMFDVNGTAYNKQFNYGRAVKSEIMIESKFDKSGHLYAFEITKTVEQRSTNIYSKYAVDTRG